MVAHRHVEEGGDIERLVLLLPQARPASSRLKTPAGHRGDFAEGVAHFVDQGCQFALTQ